ncbi:hypothetical protein L2E82_05297 [Cichorium intybus]|uniref:Uncharacterized protein n=1 Tax=Cichorium intybus TaxID=13427 RepID=A0ACB9H864_CICIN|nr:hypothetical protein L2E82_05297 [Cichorium intybus]
MSSIILSTPSVIRTAPKSYTRPVATLLPNRRSSLRSVTSIAKSFGLKSRHFFRTTAMATYKVKLIGHDGDENEFEAPDDCYILD